MVQNCGVSEQFGHCGNCFCESGAPQIARSGLFPLAFWSGTISTVARWDSRAAVAARTAAAYAGSVVLSGVDSDGSVTRLYTWGWRGGLLSVVAVDPVGLKSFGRIRGGNAQINNENERAPEK